MLRRTPQDERNRLPLDKRKFTRHAQAFVSLVTEVEQLESHFGLGHVLERRFRDEPQVQVQVGLRRAKKCLHVWLRA